MIGCVHDLGHVTARLFGCVLCFPSVGPGGPTVELAVSRRTGRLGGRCCGSYSCSWRQYAIGFWADHSGVVRSLASRSVDQAVFCGESRRGVGAALCGYLCAEREMLAAGAERMLLY